MRGRGGEVLASKTIYTPHDSKRTADHKKYDFKYKFLVFFENHDFVIFKSDDI